ncbi:Metallophosphoesterase OS=Pirellula staleyi (strain ATCC 27377 / DSM 6068 / ICPB 4128) GN=Psta_1259 PE=4 SV=1 [Gemmataceae bacterium]|nr:Metallophosphoesterase OS=Pirellula staleyi (strain ATCC 27377 / DSM 6068 / ICPB 4128) GN=Psta_1259 PE=4 SV=1 [Gemmataceae bacterium]VTT98755.1 Metallophosphoesterase OS=Pirellula staleyi (strain ATCC 27377 / DSM 6068 / ICPB 4128) GN=Psta_1259 PE=4 SV=1 [Gemmataceae bacterium]
MSGNLTRRQFAASAAAAVSLPGVLRADAPMASGDAVAFFLVGDTHFLANKEDAAKLDERSAAVTSRLIDVLNKLPGTPIPKTAGGGIVLAPRGVIHAGDCIDTGDKANLKMQETEWAAFADAYGLNGRDGKLKMPVCEVHGNHDSPRGDGLAVKKIGERNKSRPGVENVSKNGVHYSWDWGGFHFVNLGIVVGQAADPARKRRYAPLGSLEFLVSDLKEKVGTSGKSVVITHHVDMLRYAQPLPVEDKKAETMEWDPADVRCFHDALKGYNVAAILYGHTHARNVFRWDGSNKAAKDGIPTFNVDNSSHFSGKQQAFFYFELRTDGLVAREYRTDDAWETGEWTPQTWTAPAPASKK